MTYGEIKLCGACYKDKECKYCDMCKTYLCEACKNNPPKRFIAMVNRMLGREK